MVTGPGIGGLQDLSIQLSRERFREITGSLNAQIRDVLGQVLDAWRDSLSILSHAESNIILLAGQGSKIFAVRGPVLTGGITTGGQVSGDRKPPSVCLRALSAGLGAPSG